MHRVGRDGLLVLNFKKNGVRENDVVVFAFGEIDVRCHIGKQRDLFHRDLNEVIDTLVSNYLSTINENRRLFKNLICIVYSVTPPTDNASAPNFPIYGSIEDRVFITKCLNERLAQICRRKNVGFIDVFHDYSNLDGTLNLKISDGNVHINPYHNGAIFRELRKIIEKNIEE